MNDAEQIDRDLANDRLWTIVRMKEDMACLFRSMDDTLVQHRATAKAAIEEIFDNLYIREWRRNVRISGSVEWTSEIPSAARLLEKIVARERKRPVFTNPATHQAKGEPL